MPSLSTLIIVLLAMMYYLIALYGYFRRRPLVIDDRLNTVVCLLAFSPMYIDIARQIIHPERGTLEMFPLIAVAIGVPFCIYVFIISRGFSIVGITKDAAIQALVRAGAQHNIAIEHRPPQWFVASENVYINIDERKWLTLVRIHFGKRTTKSIERTIQKQVRAYIRERTDDTKMQGYHISLAFGVAFSLICAAQVYLALRS
jgi:hypothetical protein